jgi:hypothetical protein
LAWPTVTSPWFVESFVSFSRIIRASATAQQ